MLKHSASYGKVTLQSACIALSQLCDVQVQRSSLFLRLKPAVS